MNAISVSERWSSYPKHLFLGILQRERAIYGYILNQIFRHREQIFVFPEDSMPLRVAHVVESWGSA